MKTVALKLEARTKRIKAIIDLLDAEISDTFALGQELRDAGYDSVAIDRGLEALELIAKSERSASRSYSVFHGIVQSQIKPEGPQPRTGT